MDDLQPHGDLSASEIHTTLAWFPADDYREALARWPSLAEDWADCPYAEYCRRLQRKLLELSAHGVPMRSVSPIRVTHYLRWCEEEDADSASSGTRAHYAAELARRGRAIPWPPGRNDPCWCRSGRKYKRCCGAVSLASGSDAAKTEPASSELR